MALLAVLAFAQPAVADAPTLPTPDAAAGLGWEPTPCVAVEGGQVWCSRSWMRAVRGGRTAAAFFAAGRPDRPR